MPHAAGLKTILSSLKSKVRKIELSEPEPVLSALLLSVAAGRNGDSGSAAAAELYALSNAMAPRSIRDALPLPGAEDYRTAERLLPVPPHMVQEADPCILAYLYQFFSTPKREAAKRRLQSPDKKATCEETISFTQLYTPCNVVDFLLRQCMARQLGRCAIIDPSCGAGNFLVRAFDLLLERSMASGCSSEQAARHIVGSMLHGCDIDRIGLWITCLAVAARYAKLGISAGPELKLAYLGDACHAPDDSALGTLSRNWPDEHLLGRKYDAVVGNPPYLGRKLLDRKIKNMLRRHYPDAHHDLCSAFLERGLELLKPDGRLGYITQSSFLYLPSYAKLREKLVRSHQLISVVEAGPRVFPLQTGEKVASVLLVVENGAGHNGVQTKFADLTSAKTPDFDGCLSQFDNFQNLILVNQKQFLEQPKMAFNYRCPSVFATIHRQSSKLDELTEIRQGLATGDNQRFVRWWWQIDPSLLNKRFFPYVKGGGSERWYCPIETVIDWQDDGAAIKQSVAERYVYLKGKTHWVVKNERFYFKEGLTFSLVNTRQLSVRLLPPGCIFDVAGSSLFPDAEDRFWLLAYLNSSFCAAYALMLNPTVNYQVGDLKQLPVVHLQDAVRERLSRLARECVELKRSHFRFFENDMQSCFSKLRSKSFELASSECESNSKQLLDKEAEIDEIVFDGVVRQFQLDKEQRSSLERLCVEAAQRRRPIKPAFSKRAEFFQLLLRMLIYELPPDEMTVERLHQRSADFLDSFQQATGVSAFDYLLTRFEPDQKERLHGTLRLSTPVGLSRSRSSPS